MCPVGDELTPSVRVSDAERHAVVERLRRACGEGRLTLDEFSDRMDQVLAARTVGELEPVIGDLPVRASVPSSAQPVGLRLQTRRRIVAVAGSAERKHRWRLGRRTGAIAVLGSVHLDLRQAELEATEIELVVWAVLGSVEILLPEGIPVDIEGFVVMGSTDNEVREMASLPGAPHVRLRVRGVWGEVKVRSTPLELEGER